MSYRGKCRLASVQLMRHVKLMLVLLLVLISTEYMSAQNLTEGQLIGEWVCVEVRLDKSEPIPQGREEIVGSITHGFVGSHFIFLPDKMFKIQFPPGHPPELLDLNFLDNQKWEYSPEKGSVLIGGSENLMNIILAKVGENVIFYLEETPLMLRMEKSK